MMNTIFTPRDQDGRRRFRREHLVWIVPLALVGAVAFFIGIGKLVEWLWRVTVVDIFAIKPISFWQAWGLILLAQILFKANMQPTMRTRHRRRRAPVCGDSPATEPEHLLRDREG
jgi:hypothetical protein